MTPDTDTWYLTEDRGEHFTLAKIHGCSRKALDRRMHNYLKDYPPAGYATKIRVAPQECGEGCWEAVMERYSSCE